MSRTNHNFNMLNEQHKIDLFEDRVISIYLFLLIIKKRCNQKFVYIYIYE